MNEYKMQVSVKYPNGAIILGRGDTQDELRASLEDSIFVATDLGLLGSLELPKSAMTDEEALETIPVEEIEYVGKNRWVIKGGWAKQFGITCWPEVLEAADLLQHMKMDEPNKPHKEWVATYTKKPKKDGDGLTADKVIKLELA